MSFKDIHFDWLEEIIVPAIDRFYGCENDKDLIKRDVNERTIVANIYCKVNSNLHETQKTKHELDNLVIDLEYNRNYTNGKLIFGKCMHCKKESCCNRLITHKETNSYPDMIIQDRGSNKNNQVIIEFKKTSNKNEGRSNDKAKLIYFTCQESYKDHEKEDYQFRIGFFIDLDNDRYSVTTYQNTDSDEPRCNEPRSRQEGKWL